jgi:hypothetical protein
VTIGDLESVAVRSRRGQLRRPLSFTLMSGSVRIVEKPDLSDAVLNDLFRASWTSHTVRAFGPILQRSLIYLAAYQDSELVGFVNVA